MPRTVVFVGASLAGASAAATLRQEGFDGRVILIGAGLNLPGVLALRSVADGDALRHQVRPGRRAVVIGMGVIGCAVAAWLRHQVVEVIGIVDLRTLSHVQAGGDQAGVTT
jgi:NADPH-dependent 2,4-dienoyl-CoA reductase/sulfur reductase-like enzyme